MPLCFQFVNQKGETAKLDDIDRLVCEEHNLPYSATNYSLAYQALTWTGLAIANKVSKDGRTAITPEDVDKYVNENQDCFTEPESAANLKKYLCGEYTFDAWFQRH